MKIHCTLVFEYPDKKTAETIYQSTRVDDQDFVKATVNENKLEAVIESTSIPSLLHTVDDYLACVTVAEKIVDKS